MAVRLTVEPASAIRRILAADPAVDHLAESRIYAHELPAQDTDFMPRPCVVISNAPGRAQGPDARTWAALRVARLDVVAYARDRQTASLLAEAVGSVLLTISRKILPGDNLLHSCTATGGPLPSRDGDAQWPMVLTVYDALIGYPTRT